MGKSTMTRRNAVASIAGLGAAGMVAGCSGGSDRKPEPLQLDLNDPVDLSYARQKVIGSVVQEEIHSFLRFHFYGQVPGEKAVPLLSMNNYIIDSWEPLERGTYQLKHWEVGYYCDFDTDDPVESWLNPITPAPDPSAVNCMSDWTDSSDAPNSARPERMPRPTPPCRARGAFCRGVQLNAPTPCRSW